MKNSAAPGDLVVFLTVGREAGFRAASRRLGIAPSKVSTTVSRIEAAPGVPLLRHTTRSVATTEAGQALADRIAALHAGPDDACVEAAEITGRVRGRLTLNVPGAVMPDILAGILSELHARHPDVQVEIMVENSLVDIIRTGCDAGICYGDALEQDMVSIPLGPRSQQVALAASPG